MEADMRSIAKEVAQECKAEIDVELAAMRGDAVVAIDALAVNGTVADIEAYDITAGWPGGGNA